MSVEGEMSGTIPSRDSLDKQEIQPSNDLDYKQHLQRLFGEATAEYFLSQSTLETDTPLWYTQMMDRLGDDVSATAVWDALSGRSRALAMEVDANADLVKSRGAESQKSLRHLSAVRLMFRHAKHHEARSALLLEQNPSFCLQDLEDSRPASYLRQEDASPEDAFKD